MGGRGTAVTPASFAWLLLLPVAALGAPLVLLLGPAIGETAFPAPDFHYWEPEVLVRKPDVQAGYLLMVACVLAYVAALVALGRRTVLLGDATRRALVAAAQGLALALAVACVLGQRDIEYDGLARVYFDLGTLIVAVLLTALAVAALATRDRWSPRLAALPRPDPRAARWACLGAAALLAAIWALPGVFTDRGLFAPEPGGVVATPVQVFGNSFYLDEATAVINHRAPLVDLPAYGALWSYVVALPLAAFDGTYAAFTTSMAALTALAMLAVYGVLRRATAHPALALLLFVPVVASTFFIEQGTTVWRYEPGTYYGVFPLRYAGPYLLAWLTAIYVARDAPARAGIPLFAAAGLVALNNVDFGVSALAGTLAAVVLTRRPLRPGRLAAELAAGAALALALVSAVTLAHAGSLPQLELLGRYGRLFVSGGFGNLPLPAGLGIHVVMTMTFVAALAVAAVRVAAAAGAGRVLVAMLAWTGIFGLGASMYYYAYRSHPDVLVNLFSVWALALALLVVAALGAQGARRWPAAPTVVVLFGFAVAACSVGQIPLPWDQVRRIGETALPTVDEPMRLRPFTRAVDARSRPGERVAVLAPVGHRVAREAGVVNVAPYTGLRQMPTREQLDETLDVLRREGGTTVFVAEEMREEIVRHVLRRGFAGRSLGAPGWLGAPTFELRRTRSR